MAEAPVVNASPLILLTRAGHVAILERTAERILVPSAVASEIRAYGSADPTAAALASSPWLGTVTVDAMPLEVARWDLGPGESEVLAWALGHPGTLAIIDDLAARRCAAALGVPVRGTLGLVLLAKSRGQIESAKTVLRDLRDAGMYLSDDVTQRALALVGE